MSVFDLMSKEQLAKYNAQQIDARRWNMARIMLRDLKRSEIREKLNAMDSEEREDMRRRLNAI